MKFFPFFLGMLSGLIAAVLILILEPNFPIFIKIVIIASSAVAGTIIGFIPFKKNVLKEI
ncbi:MAG: hypothetical protein ACTSSG_12555 [Candidatus Heimdallarchaeaceae archaeon]